MVKNLNNKTELIQRIAKLESQVDILETELTYLNNLCFTIGFPGGLVTLKEAAEEIRSEGTASVKITQRKPHKKKV